MAVKYANYVEVLHRRFHFHIAPIIFCDTKTNPFLFLVWPYIGQRPYGRHHIDITHYMTQEQPTPLKRIRLHTMGFDLI
jgi:hypothetical protein